MQTVLTQDRFKVSLFHDQHPFRRSPLRNAGSFSLSPAEYHRLERFITGDAVRLHSISSGLDDLALALKLWGFATPRINKGSGPESHRPFHSFLSFTSFETFIYFFFIFAR